MTIIENYYKIKDLILTVKCNEVYENLPKKVILALKYLYENTNYDYILKIDDDTLINTDNLTKYINKHFYNLDYMGGLAGGHVDKKWHFGKCSDELLNNKEYWHDYNGYWCGGGFGYILSRSAVNLLLKNENYSYIFDDEIYEDKAIGNI